MKRIAVVDYGVGNLKSIANALGYLGLSHGITGDFRELEAADAILLPGVGAFPDAAQRLRATGLDRVICAQAACKPILGICLGMQLLFDSSTEGEDCEGLHLVSGKVRRIPTACKLPHIGWNTLTFSRENPLFHGLPDGVGVYFVHSFSAQEVPRESVLAVTDYGCPVVAAVGQGRVYGCQFHPEKSGEAGLHILRNFGELVR